MLLAAAFIFTIGVLLFLWDFFILNPRRGAILSDEPVPGEERVGTT